jgi:Tfp pilus assembly protein PilN
VSRAPDFSTRAGPSQPGRGREIALLAVAALVFLASGFSAFRAGAEARAAGAYLAGLRGEIEQERARLRALEGRQRSGGSVLTSKLVLTAEAPPARVLADLAVLLPPDVRLDSLALSYGARLEIEAQAVARRPASYDLFLERLSASPLFGEILPGSEARAAGMRGTLRMVYRRLP